MCEDTVWSVHVRVWVCVGEEGDCTMIYSGCVRSAMLNQNERGTFCRKGPGPRVHEYPNPTLSHTLPNPHPNHPVHQSAALTNANSRGGGV